MTHTNSYGTIQTDHQISARRPNLIVIKKKKKKRKKKERTYKIEDFADYRLKLKETEKKDNYLDFA